MIEEALRALLITNATECAKRVLKLTEADFGPEDEVLITRLNMPEAGVQKYHLSLPLASPRAWKLFGTDVLEMTLYEDGRVATMGVPPELLSAGDVEADEDSRTLPH